MNVTTISPKKSRLFLKRLVKRLVPLSTSTNTIDQPSSTTGNVETKPSDENDSHASSKNSNWTKSLSTETEDSVPRENDSPLSQVVSHHRRQIHLPVIVITESLYEAGAEVSYDEFDWLGEEHDEKSQDAPIPAEAESVIGEINEKQDEPQDPSESLSPAQEKSPTSDIEVKKDVDNRRESSPVQHVDQAETETTNHSKDLETGQIIPQNRTLLLPVSRTWNQEGGILHCLSDVVSLADSLSSEESCMHQEPNSFNRDRARDIQLQGCPSDEEDGMVDIDLDQNTDEPLVSRDPQKTFSRTDKIHRLVEIEVQAPHLILMPKQRYDDDDSSAASTNSANSDSSCLFLLKAVGSGECL